MYKIIKNTFKIILNKKSFIMLGIIMPSIMIVFFSFAIGTEPSYRVGIVDNDKSYTSYEIIKAIKTIDNIELVNINNKNYDFSLLTHELELVIIINNGLENNLLNLTNDDISVKSITNSDIKSIVTSIINSKLEDLSIISRISQKDIVKYKELIRNYNEKNINYTVNNTKNESIDINKSIGIIVMMIFITGANIANFLIEENEYNTKSRVLISGVKPWKYYLSMLIVFTILSSITSIIYYLMCKLLNINFKMENGYYFLIVILLLNLLSVCFNLFIVSLSKSRYIASTLNILVVIPSCMLSGMFWDFNIMPKYLQNIGSILPTRWAYQCIELLQKNNDLLNLQIYTYNILILSFILFIISIIINKTRGYYG